jgi:2-methylisocitrate lyase-like PEP mutase family enzyme
MADAQDPFSARRLAFERLHRTGCFVVPNPWDIGSARLLEHLGFQALATTSAGFQFTRGRADTVWGTSCDEAIDHIRKIVLATDLPVNADFQSGYAHKPEEVARNVTRCIETGIAGLSIEDATGDPHAPLYDLPLAAARIEAAAAAITASGAPVLLTARAESYLVDHPVPLEDVLRRLTAYAEAGADVLFAPGPRQPDELRQIVRAVAPRPVNVLVLDPKMTLADLAALGVRRVSVGSALARTAWAGFLRAARSIAQDGRFDALADATPFADLNAVFGEP